MNSATVPAREPAPETGSATTSSADARVAPGRVVSIDALRGFDMFWIVGGAGAFQGLLGLLVQPTPEWLAMQMKHVSWEGFTAWDLIMPLFLFIVGAAMPFSFGRRIAAGHSRSQIYRKVLLRFVILFVLGMVAQGNLLEFKLETLRLYSNTLQAIACGYLIASVALLQLPLLGQLVLTMALVLGYWLLLVLVPTAGAGGPFDPQHNLAMVVDEFLLGRFRDGTTYTWILSSLGFGATVMLGVFGGHLLHSAVAPWKKVGWLLFLGGSCLGLAWAWSSPALGDWRCPIIKHIWSSSMILWAGGLSYLLLGLFYLLIDVCKWQRWAYLFIVIGANAIFAYMFWDLFGGDLRHMAETLVGGIADGLSGTQSEPLARIGQALLKITPFGLLWLALWYMYRQRTFIRI
ncbi:MAG: DUF5009 domain-containing protein [Planctomycetales bacterium]|nr:DUF5009 domain-containing protein [Planctomycetales bacterium]